MPASVCAEAIAENVSKNAKSGRHGTQGLFAAELEFTGEVLFILSLSVSIGLPNVTVGGTWNVMRKQRHGDSLGGSGTPQPSSRLATMLNNPASYLGAPAHIRRLDEASRESAFFWVQRAARELAPGQRLSRVPTSSRGLLRLLDG